MNNTIQVPLAALIHRIGSDNTKQAKVIAAQYDCELKRVRRSRNWLLLGEAMDVQSFCRVLKSQHSAAFAHLIGKIDAALLCHGDKLEPLTAKLARLIAATPSITLGELMQITQCSLTEARLARFNADAWD
ncbi:ribosome recycling factor family protein [Shewanella sp. SR44-3]|uniref:ribosome recycling factor family protein n=1 Tax=unclassified Shewanella TaxID=196818 RepID=UPI0015F8DD29|nr:ribosome recycling factor family protein [Shewanella sp. SR44-3]MBB1268648.1 ribosome recycling factor family protein [Shewanella sp. SR44-3]